MTDKAFSDSEMERLRAAVRQYGSQAKLASSSGLAPATLSQILKGEGDVTMSRMRRITETLGISIDSILDGGIQRQIVREPREQFVFQQQGDLLVVPFDDVQASAGGGASADDSNLTISGFGFPAEWARKKLIEYRTMRICTVRGDSMEPTLSDGDVVLYDTARATAVDGIYVYRVADDLLVKRLVFRGETVLVVSDNKIYPPYELPVRDIDIKGRVVWAGGAV